MSTGKGGMIPPAQGVAGNPAYMPKVMDLQPEEDFTKQAAADREAIRRLDYSDTRRELNRKIVRLETEPPALPAQAAGRGGVPASNRANMAVSYFQQVAEDLTNDEYLRRSASPNFAGYNSVKHLIQYAKDSGLDVTADEVQNLVDFGVLNSAADQAIIAYRAGFEPGVRNVFLTLEQNDPVMASILPDVINEKLIQAIEDPTITQNIVQGIGEAAGYALAPLIAASDWVQEGWRAGAYQQQTEEAAGMRVGPGPNLSGFAYGFFNSRDQVQNDDFNNEYLKRIEESGDYSPLQYQIALDVFKAAVNPDGDPNPITRLLQDPRYANDEEAIKVFRDIAYSRTDGNTQELLRQIDSAFLGNTGQVLFGGADPTALFDPARGSEFRQDAANAAAVAVAVATDPTIALGRASKLYKAFMWGLDRLAPGAGPAAKVLAKGRLGRLGIENPAYRYMNNFANDLNRLDELEKSAREATDAARKARLTEEAASFRNRMTRQYDEMPEDLIEEFRTSPWRNVDGKFDVEHIAAAIDDMNDAFVVGAGGIADKIALQGATQAAIQQAKQELFAQASFYGRVAAKNQKRTALVPRMSLARQIRKDAVNRIAFNLMPQSRALAIVNEYLKVDGDPAAFAESLSDNALAFGTAARKYKFGEGLLDSGARLFSSIPTLTSVSVTTAEDAQTVYRYARLFFSKRTSELIAEQFRAGNEGSRRLLLSGLVRSGAASRGLTMTAADADSFVKQLTPKARGMVTGSMQGEKYGVSVGMLPSERAALVDDAKNTYPVYRADRADVGLEWDKPQGVYMSQVDDAAKSPHRSDVIREAGGVDRVIEYQGRVRKSDVFDVKPVEVDMTGLRASDGTFASGLTVNVDAGVGYVLSHMRDGQEWLAVARNSDGKVMSDAFRSRLSAFDSSVNWDRFFDNYERLMAVGGIQARRDGRKALRMVDPEYAKYKDAFPDWQDMTEIVVLDRNSVLDGPASANAAKMTGGVDGATVSLSADSNGIEHALHLHQTAERVALPTIKDFEDLRNGLRTGTTNVASKVTDFWSLGTLFGLRFSLRNAIEELGLYWLTAGNLADLYKGRKLSQAIRKVRPRIYIENIDGVPTPVLRTSLGMIANKAEWTSRRLKDWSVRWGKYRGFGDWMAELIFRGADEDALKAAGVALAGGDTEAFARLAIRSVAQQKVFGFSTVRLNADEQAAFAALVDSTHGIALLDEIGEAAPYLNSGGFPAYATKAFGIEDAVPGVEYGQIRNFRFGDYQNVEPIGRDVAGRDVYGLGFWWRELQSTLDGDGPIGEAAVRGLTNPAKAKAEIAKIIREDKTFRYAEKYSRIRTDADIDQFASDYFENVFQHFTKQDGTLNLDLRARFMTVDDQGNEVATWWQELTPDEVRLANAGEWTDSEILTIGRKDGYLKARVGRNDLSQYSRDARPDYIFGRDVIHEPYIPVPMDMPAILSIDRAWGWMGRQNARLSREPIFLANYLRAYKQTGEARESLARAMAKSRAKDGEDVVITATDREVAELTYSRIAMDDAFSRTLAYVDNPANRSNLAWKARNVSRYYRATEDFYRRIKRIVKNDPVAIWKGALTYQLLGDYGFTYTNDNGEEYFAYPGNQYITNALAGGITIPGTDITTPGLASLWGVSFEQYKDLNPFSLNARVLGLAPSTDPNQLAATFAGPMVAPVSGILSAFPQLAGLRTILFGVYNQSTGNPLADTITAMLPANVAKVLRMSNAEWVTGQITQVGVDTMALMAAEGMLDRVTMNGKPYTDASGNEILTAEIPPDQFKLTDQYKASQAIAWSLFIHKLVGGFVDPAAPNLMADNASDFAKRYGIDDMDDMFKDLLDEKTKAGDPFPFESALSQFYAMKASEMIDGEYMSFGTMLPFTVSRYKDNPNKKQQMLATIRTTDDWVKWLRTDSTKDLAQKYADVYLFLGPQSGEFTWEAWAMATTILDLKVKKSEEEQIQEILAISGQVQENQIKAYYDPLIEQDPENADAYEAEKKAFTDLNAAQNPWHKRAKENFNTAWSSSENINSVMYRMTDMLKYIKQRDGSLTVDQEAIESAIEAYNYYKPQMDRVQGTAAQKNAAKKQLRAQLQTMLDAAKASSPVAQRFIESVVESDPDYMYGVR